MELYGSLRLAIRQTYPEFCTCLSLPRKRRTKNENEDRRTKTITIGKNSLNHFTVESKVPEKGWGNIEYRRKYFCKLAEELKFDPFVPENWQKVTRAQVRARPVRHPLHSPSTTPLSPSSPWLCLTLNMLLSYREVHPFWRCSIILWPWLC